MQEPDHHIQNVASSSIVPQQSVHDTGSRLSKVTTTQNSSPTVFSGKRAKAKTLRQNEINVASECPERGTIHEHRIDIGEEHSGLLGYEVLCGKLALDKKFKNRSADDQDGSGIGNSEIVDAKLTSKTLTWGSQKLSLADVISLAGFQMEIIKTTSPGHARNLASTVDFGTCPDGIICVGGDGIVNEVLNGLLSRCDQKEAISIPIGIIPTGSDNSLVWTVLGVKDPISAAITIIKGGLTAMDVFAVEWIQTGSIHYGTTVSYFGFLSNVLELSEKYQKRFGPFRYFVAGFLKFLCLPQYNYELEYLPVSKELSESDGKVFEDEDGIDMSDLYTDIMRRANKEDIPKASSLSSIDSIKSPTKKSGGDVETIGSSHANSEPSHYVRGLDSKSKRLSVGRSNLVTEPEEVIHPQLHLSTTPNMPRTRSKSRTDKGWTGLTSTSDSRSSWGTTASNDREDISSTVSDPGPVWDSEPKWDTEPNWESQIPIQLPGPSEGTESARKKELVPKLEHKWIVKKGQFIAVLVCNHSCKTVQSLSSQVIAPKALHDDNSLDLLLVHGSGRMKLLRFFVRLQFGRHLSLPFVEYLKVKSVKIKPGKSSHNGCGIDGEIFSINRQVICYLLPEQYRLIGRHPARD